MPKEHLVNLNCSFCGKNQREVKKLIAGPTVYICDECIGSCNDIIAAEDADRSGADAPDEARALFRFRIERLARETDALIECVQRSASAFPAHLRRPASHVALASEGLRAAASSWSAAQEGVAAPPVAVWIQPEEVLDALRRALAGSVPPERLIALERSLDQLSEVRDVLVLGARAEGGAQVD